MSIELNRARVAGAIVACECAQAALGKAIRLAEEASRDLAAELNFGNDPNTPEGAKLVRYGAELKEYLSALINADIYAPHSGEAMTALSLVATRTAPQAPAPVVNRPPTPAAYLNLSRSLA